MSIKNTFREVAIGLSSKQPELVDYLLEDAPILDVVPFQPTSSGLNHVYEELLDVTGAGLVDLDGELTNVDSTSELKQTALSILGGTIEVGEDKAKQFGSAGAYFAGKIPAVLRKTGADTETSILYNSLRSAAILARSNTSLTGRLDHAISATGNSNTNYSIICVKWEPGAVTGLYDPNGFGRGLLFDMEAINGGDLYYTKQSAYKTLGYGMRMKSYFSILTANPRNISTIVNIDISDANPANWDLPTSAQIDDIIDAVRGQVGGNTMLLMHPKVKSALGSFKEAKLNTFVQEGEYKRTFDAWNGIPLVTSYNFLNGTETNVTLA